MPETLPEPEVILKFVVLMLPPVWLMAPLAMLVSSATLIAMGPPTPWMVLLPTPIPPAPVAVNVKLSAAMFPLSVMPGAVNCIVDACDAASNTLLLSLTKALPVVLPELPLIVKPGALKLNGLELVPMLPPLNASRSTLPPLMVPPTDSVNEPCVVTFTFWPLTVPVRFTPAFVALMLKVLATPEDDVPRLTVLLDESKMLTLAEPATEIVGDVVVTTTLVPVLLRYT